MITQFVFHQIILISKKNIYKLIAEDLSKQHVLNTDPKAIQQINSAGNLDCAGSPCMVFIFKEVK